MDLHTFAETDIKSGRPRQPCRVCALPSKVRTQVNESKDAFTRATVARWLESSGHKVSYAQLGKHFAEAHDTDQGDA